MNDAAKSNPPFDFNLDTALFAAKNARNTVPNSLNIRLRVASSELSFVKAIFDDAYQVEVIEDSAVRERRLIFGSDIDLESRNQIVTRLQPIQMKTEVGSLDRASCVELHLPVVDLSNYNVRLSCNSQEGQERIGETLRALVPELEQRPPQSVNGNSIRFGGAPQEVIDTLTLLCLANKIPFLTAEKAWGDQDQDIWLDLQDPEVEGKPLREWVPIAIVAETNDFNRLKAVLERQGFKKVRLATGRERRQLDFGFSISPNLYKAQSNQQGELAVLRDVVQSFMGDSGVDLSNYPLQVTEQKKGYAAIINMPLNEYRAGMPAYGGDQPGAFPVTIYTDSEEYVSGLKDRLRVLGYNVRCTGLPEGGMPIVSMDWGAFRNHANAEALKREVNAFLQSPLGLAPIEPIDRKAESAEINLYLPTPNPVLSKRSIEQRWARRFIVHVNISAHDPRAEEIQKQVRDLGFRRIRLNDDLNGPGDNIIHFGGCPTPLVAKLKQIFEPYSDEALQLEQVWPESDRDVFIFIPPIRAHFAVQNTTFDIHAWLTPDEAIAQERPFLVDDTTQLQIGLMTLDKVGREGHPLTPSPADFVHYCIDSQTAKLLERIAESVAGREPILLEGVTATSKTSSILFLASILGQPVLRLNLSGATDVSEFVGRFIPDEDRAGNGWKWEDGPVVKAMLNGYWLILDELNLGEPAILERLNSILERQPRLILTEHNDRYIGGPEYPVHPNFRVFGTQNPDRYIGRNALSPAYRDRFYETQVEDPNLNVESMLSMLMWMGFGEAPSVELYGRRYGADARQPQPFQLTNTADVRQFLNALAIFHSSLAASCSSAQGALPAIGGDKAGGYAFTRRGLIRVLSQLERLNLGAMTLAQRCQAYRQTLTRVYLERVDAQSASQVADLLDAAGIGPQTWLISEG